MTLASILLEKLAEWRPAPGRQTLEAADGPWAVAVTADRGDQLGCLVWELALRRTAPAESPRPVRDWAERVARRARGLLESLKVVEVDAGRDAAVLRSDEPDRRGDEVFYYEVFLKGDAEATLRRFRGSRQAAGRREQVPFAVTHEAIAKLVGDLTA
jgi:hypothetical protein